MRQKEREEKMRLLNESPEASRARTKRRKERGEKIQLLNESQKTKEQNQQGKLNNSFEKRKFLDKIVVKQGVSEASGKRVTINPSKKQGSQKTKEQNQQGHLNNYFEKQEVLNKTVVKQGAIDSSGKQVTIKPSEKGVIKPSEKGVINTSAKNSVNNTSVKQCLKKSSETKSLNKNSVKLGTANVPIKQGANNTSVKQDVKNSSLKKTVNSTSLKQRVSATTVKQNGVDTSKNSISKLSMKTNVMSNSSSQNDKDSSQNKNDVKVKLDGYKDKTVQDIQLTEVMQKSSRRSRSRKKSKQNPELDHSKMRSKLSNYYKLSLKNFNEFVDDILLVKEELKKYIDAENIPHDNMYLLFLLFEKSITNQSLFEMTVEYLKIILDKKYFHHYLLIWSSKMDVSKCKMVASAYLNIVTLCLYHKIKFLTHTCLNGLQKFVDFLDDKNLSKRVKDLSQYFYNQHIMYQKSGASSLHLKFVDYTDLVTCDDFRRLPTFPTMDDFDTKTKPSLRPIKEKGCYKNGEEYLDIHYRLIREDLLFTLREGVNELRENITDKKINLTVYQDLQVLYPICTHRGVTFKVCFGSPKMHYLAWEQSRNLIFGSLLCFSNDNFKTMIFGTVSDRNSYELQRGFFDVCFQNSSDMYNYCRKNSSLQMVECPTFFEAYRHVMDCFKEINPYAMPMKKYLIDNKTSGQLPAYLKVAPDTAYDMSSTLEDQQCQNILISQTTLPSSIKLNSSQLEALHHSLTNEFSVIQGPPGTGKTYCGLRIVHCLLSNQHVWNKKKDNPMLIVCFTNHALDQFLKGLLKFGHKKIIRVGGRACEDLEPYLLKNHISKFRFKALKSDMYKDLHSRRKMSANNLKDFAQQLEPYLYSVKKFQEAIKKGKLVKFSEVKHCILQRHAKAFEEQDQHCNSLKISIFDIYLDLCKIPLPILRNVSRLDKDYFCETIPCETENVISEPIYETTDLIEVIGEGKALTERWVVDEDEFKPLLFNHIYTADCEKDIENENSMFVDEEGFKLVTMSKTKKALQVRTKLEKCVAMNKTEVDAIENPWLVPVDDRWRLYKYWLELFMMDYDDKIAKQMQQYEESCRFAAQVREEEQDVVLRQADVIAMTTTCASRMRFVLQSIKPKIVVIEEAAEVLEAHIVASLLKETEHCILIGDHKQLRPNPNVHMLAKDYNLDLSLFERMVNNGMKCPSLNVQHRMRPLISSNLKYIYPNLIDHASVRAYPHVLGVEKNMFFINHSEPESFRKLGSKANLHEAKFIKSFCFYLLQQGYQPNQITILTGYSEQLLELQKRMPKDRFGGVKVTTVDNFQGEENDIILLSLVRSNERGSIGFLNIENRVCVALSRAKHGLYVIGNFQLLSENNLLWQKIINDVKNSGCYGDFLLLCCQNHPETKIAVRNEIDFENAPEGGCQLMCGFILQCGHVCDTFCHPYDKFHEEYDCRERCLKQMCKNKKHLCLHKCHFGNECNPCDNLVEKKFELCGHISQVPCSVSTSEAVCQETCYKLISCGHQCSNKCGEKCLDKVNCTVLVSKVLKCGHVQSVFCNQDPDVAQCNKTCEVELACGHTCSGTCFQCFEGTYHMKCTMSCKKFHTCPHECKVRCGQTCLPCEQPCLFQCSHRICPNKCFETCKKCLEPCKNRCLHKKCTKLCYEECNIDPCNKRCSLLQKCRHQCYGLCGETCPSYCLRCFSSSNLSSFPLIVLNDCGHVFSVSEIDALFEKKHVSSVAYIMCPSCNEPILNTKRYRKQIKNIRDAFSHIYCYNLKKELSFAVMILNKSYDVCRDLSNFMMKTPMLTSQEKQDYTFIINNKNLVEFQTNLDLRYLARSSTKSETLLIAERLIQSKSVLEAQRLYNQLQILVCVNYIQNDLKQKNSNEEVQCILNDLHDILYNTMDNALTYQESLDLSQGVQKLQFLLQLMLCKQSIELMLEKKNQNASLAEVYVSLKESISKLHSVGLSDTLKQRKKIFQMLNGYVSIPLTHITKPTLILIKEENWNMCNEGHIFTEFKEINCPKCYFPSFEITKNMLNNFEALDSSKATSHAPMSESLFKHNNIPLNNMLTKADKHFKSQSYIGSDSFSFLKKSYSSEKSDFDELDSNDLDRSSPICEDNLDYRDTILSGNSNEVGISLVSHLNISKDNSDINSNSICQQQHASNVSTLIMGIKNFFLSRRKKR
ncbi:NFX1-type zinc finger-containing protein 1 isoform X4 [Hydra vulgaris]